MTAGTTPQREPDPPTTGEPQIDQAMAGLATLGEAPLTEYHRRLAEAHDVLRDALSGQAVPEPEADARDEPAGS